MRFVFTNGGHGDSFNHELSGPADDGGFHGWFDLII
jgi:hypothetical protein